MQRFRVDLKTFWAWLCLTNTAMQLKVNIRLVCRWKKTPKPNDPYI